MTTPDDDRFAEAFRRSLGAGPDVDADAALSRVTARSRVVRRRRMAVRAGGLLAAAVTVLALWLAVRPGDDATIETVDSPSTSTLTGSSSVAPSTAAPSSTSSVPVTAAAPVVTGSPVPGATTGPTATNSPTTPTNPTVPETTPAPTAPPPTPPPSIGPTTYSGLGGSMTVRVEAGNLVLVGVQPAAGYAITEQKADERDAEVRFESGDARTRIRVRLENGELVPEIEDT